MLNFREYKIVFSCFGEITRSSASGFTAADERRLPVCHEPAPKSGCCPSACFYRGIYTACCKKTAPKSRLYSSL